MSAAKIHSKVLSNCVVQNNCHCDSFATRTTRKGYIKGLTSIPAIITNPNTITR